METELKDIMDKIKEGIEAGDFGITKIIKVEREGIGINVFINEVCHSRCIEKLQKIAKPHYKHVFISTRDKRYDIMLRII
jgi:hypothetical protein